VSYDPKVFVDGMAARAPESAAYWAIGEAGERWFTSIAKGGRVKQTRSILPVCSAERHAALERLAEAVRDYRGDPYSHSHHHELTAALAAVEAAR
jgi:hypothetical protein